MPPAKPQHTETKGEFSTAASDFEDGMARICRLYGLTPLLGRLYAVLFLSPRPLALDELCQRVGAAKSTVSVALRKLNAVRVVRRLPPRGDRRDFYEAVADPWEVFADWDRMYFQPELEMWRTSGEALSRGLAAPDAPVGEDNDRIRQRLDGLRGFIELFARLVTEASGKQSAAAPARSVPITVEDA